ncbi:hypothetical protein [Arthrobacter sp. Hz1]
MFSSNRAGFSGRGMFAAGPSEEAAVGSAVAGSDGVGVPAGGVGVPAGAEDVAAGVDAPGLVGPGGPASPSQPATRKPKTMANAAVKLRER